MISQKANYPFFKHRYDLTGQMNQNPRRQFTRIRFSRKVTLYFQANSYGPCRIKDLSLGGMFVFGDFKEEDGALCRVFFKQTGTDSVLTLKATAQVIRAGKEGVAIEFISMAFDSYMFLQTSLLYEAEDPLSIGLELPEDCPFELTEDTVAIPDNNETPGDGYGQNQDQARLMGVFDE